MHGLIHRIATRNSARATGAAATVVATLAIVACTAGVLITLVVLEQPLLTMVLLVAFSVTGALTAALFEHLAQLCGQRSRDLAAQELFAALENDETSALPFVLYLRPFVATDVFDVSNIRIIPAGARPGTAGGFVAPRERFELEAQLAEAVQGIGPLVALGIPLEHIGAGRILVGDDAWREAIALLIRRARLIILLPSSRNGTLWEIKRLLDTGAIERTILIDPPNGSVSGIEFDHSAEWGAVRGAFAAVGYTLPEDDPKGLLHFFGSNRQPQLSQRLDISHSGELRKFFQNVLANVRQPDNVGGIPVA